jgi:hypothetical protein
MIIKNRAIFEKAQNKGVEIELCVEIYWLCWADCLPRGAEQGRGA